VLITEHIGLFSSTHLVKDHVSVTYSASAFRWNDIMSASEMVTEETETVENAKLIYAKWSLLSIKLNIIIITFNIPTSALHSKCLFMYGGKGLC
jgi:hypothetical protein